MACECISKVNELLAPMNGKLGLMFVLDADHKLSDTVRLTVEKLDPAKRGRDAKPPAMAPTFCPFCGVRYKVEDA